MRGAGRRVLTAWLSLALLAAVPGAAIAQKLLPVVATFSILGDMVREVGGERVSLTTIVGPNGDSHSFEPSPKDVKALARASVLVENGLDFESWLPRLVRSSGFRGLRVVASRGIAPMTAQEEAGHAGPHGSHDHGAHQHDGGVDPHAWQDLRNGMIYARNVADGLSKADPENKAYYQKRADAYIAQMEKLDAEIRQALSAIPPERRVVITSHDAFEYFGRAYGIRFLPAAGLSNDAEPSAGAVAALIDQARKEGVSAIFVENASNPALVTQIAKETGAEVNSTLYSDALSAPDRPAATYLGMFSWNAGQLIYALKSGARRP